MQKDTVRFTFDLPAALHACIKVAAAKEGVSMKNYILYSLTYKMEHEGKAELDNETFKKELSKMAKKDAKLMRYLSDK